MFCLVIIFYSSRISYRLGNCSALSRANLMGLCCRMSFIFGELNNYWTVSCLPDDMDTNAGFDGQTDYLIEFTRIDLEPDGRMFPLAATFTSQLFI